MQKNLHTLLGVRAASSLGDQVLVFAIPILVFKLTGSAAMSGVAFAIEWIPRLIAMPLCGTLAQKIGARKTLLIADVARVIFTFAMVFLLAYGIQEPETLVLLLGLYGGLIGFFHEMAFVSMETFAPKVAPGKDLAALQGALQAIDQVTQILGPALAGFLLLWLPTGPFLMLLAGVFSIGFVFTVTNRSLREHFSAKPNFTEDNKLGIFDAMLDLFTDLQSGFKFFLSSSELRALSFAAVGMNFTFGIVLSGGASFFARDLQLPPEQFAIFGTLGGVFSVVTLMIVPKILKRTGIREIGIAGMIFFLAGSLMMGVGSSVWAFALGYIALFIGVGFFNVFMRTKRVTFIPEKMLGSVLGAILFVNFACMPVSGLVWAYASQERDGFRTSLCAAFLGLFVINMVFKSAIWNKVDAANCAPSDAPAALTSSSESSG